jgi:hypothetical protein
VNQLTICLYGRAKGFIIVASDKALFFENFQTLAFQKSIYQCIHTEAGY